LQSRFHKRKTILSESGADFAERDKMRGAVGLRRAMEGARWPVRVLARRRCTEATGPPLLPPNYDHPQRLTICLDLDECLIHCRAEEAAGSEALSFMEPSGPEAARVAAAHAQLHSSRRDRAVRPLLPPDAELELPYLDAPLLLRKRPLMDDFLAEAAKLGELVLYTSAAEGYARLAMEHIDPDGTLFEGRLLTRVDCTLLDNIFIKDLRRLNRPLERLVCVDDHIASCMLTPDNLAVVQPFLGDPEDRELSTILPVLRTLSVNPALDVRDTLRGTFAVKERMLKGLREAKGKAG
jgi:hypothetical protein